jgi:hypothetical protein
MKITEVLISLLIACILTIGTVLSFAFISHKRSLPYVFFDDSIHTERHQLELDKRGGYEISYWRSKNERIFSESGTYSDSGGNALTLTNGDNRTYKVQVWGRDSERPQYRVIGN